MTECLVRHHERGTFRTTLQMKSEGSRQWRAVITTDSSRQPIRLGIVEIHDVHDGIINKPAAHSARGVRFPFDLIQPRRRIVRRIARSEICDYVRQARMVYREEHRTVFALHKGFDVTISGTQ
jgi:hypothetical protein